MRRFLSLLPILLLAGTVSAAEVPPDVVVAADGSGNFKTVTQALKSIPKDNPQRIIILVKNGVYKEKVSVDVPFITLRGESRKDARIEFNQANDDATQNAEQAGQGVVNLRATDFVLENITVMNTMGVIGPHAMALYGTVCDRTVVIDSDVLSEGADTVSLWQGDDGRYYHARSSFRGSVDSVCPRGWCYAVDCSFSEARAGSAVTWQDGSKNKEQKFVMRGCTFTGADGFFLARHHHDANLMYIDCTFAKNMADHPPYRVLYPTNGGPPSEADKKNNLEHDATNIWGERNYFFNSHREGGGDFAWMKDNLASFSPALKPEEVTAAWTFAKSPSPWDPESKIGPKITSITSMGNRINVTFSESVTVKGKPKLTLSDNTTGSYAAGSGSATLLFDAPGSSKPKSIDLAGGYIFATAASATTRMADLTQ